jgi:hypothetical protein
LLAQEERAVGVGGVADVAGVVHSERMHLHSRPGGFEVQDYEVFWRSCPDDGPGGTGTNPIRARTPPARLAASSTRHCPPACATGERERARLPEKGDPGSDRT